MFLGKRDKFHNPLIEALGEPAFVFNESGDFLFCNYPARHILKLLDYAPERKPENIYAFTQILKFASMDSDESILALGEMKHHLAHSRFEDGQLLRLIPVQESDHLVRLSYSLNVMPWGLITLELLESGPVVIFCNKKADDFLQLPHSKMIGLTAEDIFKKFQIDGDWNEVMMSREASHRDHERQEDGKTCWYRFHFIPYKFRNPHCLIVIEDSTERKIKEGQYFQAQRLEALGQLAGGIAHDFNNILSIIDGYARMARKVSKGNDDALDYLEKIKQSVQRGAGLTGRLLTFGHHRVVKDDVVDLGDLIQDQEPLLRQLLDASIALTMNVREGIYAEVTPDHICQILMNLCANARDAMKNGGSLSIECGSADKDRAYFSVTDTGEGIPPEIQSKIFDPFFTTKERGKGTGLGLSMVYGLVKDMKGEIDVQSKTGEGTRICITLPLSQESPVLKRSNPEEAGELDLHGFTALIAEDEPALLELVSGMMEEMGLKVLKASNGNEALMLQEDYGGQIDFLLTDVVMPEINGVKLAELFSSLRPDSKVMFMSGYPEDGQMARVTLPENAFFIPKPVDFKTLSTIIKDMAQGQNNDSKSRWKYLMDHWRSV